MSAVAIGASAIERWRRGDVLEHVSRIGTIAMLVTALVAAVAAPVLAVWWTNLPFPGFLVEQSLVVNGFTGDDWSGSEAGIGHPERVIRLAGRSVADSGEYLLVLSGLESGSSVSVLTETPDGNRRFYLAIELGPFARSDAVRLFLVPYLVGLAYTAIGLWTYRARGSTRPGRALAFFCFASATIGTLFFDLSTTHVGSSIWILAVAMAGGGVLSLAMRFPTEWGPVRRMPWLLGVPYVASAILAVANVAAMSDAQDPWAYIDTWGATYRYVALAIAVFVATMLHRSVSAATEVARKQAVVVLFGGAIAFIPVGIWFVAPLLGWSLPFAPVLMLPPLLAFPLAVGVAIQRYRLLEAELIVSRALLYGLLTTILAAVTTVTVTALQRLFVAVTGEKSDVAVIVTTLFVLLILTPIRTALQATLDRRLKGAEGFPSELEELHDHADVVASLARPDALLDRVLDRAVSGLRAESGALAMEVDGRWRVVRRAGHWTGESWLAVPLEVDGRRLAVLSLGPRRDGRPYADDEKRRLAVLGADVAQAWTVASAIAGLPGGESSDATARPPG